jgi:hypothetical protein
MAPAVLGGWDRSPTTGAGGLRRAAPNPVEDNPAVPGKVRAAGPRVSTMLRWAAPPTGARDDTADYAA